MKIEFWETMDMYVIYSEDTPIELCRTKQRAIAYARKYARKTGYKYQVFSVNFNQKLNFNDLYLTGNPIFIAKEEC